jgi:hypothetical protein
MAQFPVVGTHWGPQILRVVIGPVRCNRVSARMAEAAAIEKDVTPL